MTTDTITASSGPLLKNSTAEPATTADPYLISFDKVVVSYPMDDGSTKVVLSVDRFDVRQGEFVSLIGPTGCGKSTLLRLVLGAQFPVVGSVTVGGAPVTGIGRDRGIVFQKYGLFPNLTVLENIAVGPELERISLPQRILHTPAWWRARRESKAPAREYIERIGLTGGDCDKYPHELSGGMRQRVALAQALIMKPRVILMDEPFGALDDATRRGMQELILREWDQHDMTILFVTHSLEEAIYLGTRVVGISQHWSDDKGKSTRGAVIVSDRKVPGDRVNPPDFKYDPVFSGMVAALRHDVLDPDAARSQANFIMDHPDAWHPVHGRVGDCGCA